MDANKYGNLNMQQETEQRLNLTVPPEKELWTPTEAAAYLGYNRSYFINEFCKQPGFPPMVKSATSRRMRWRKQDILNWATGD